VDAAGLLTVGCHAVSIVTKVAYDICGGGELHQVQVHRLRERVPVDCFYEGETMLVIHPDECIDCGVCEPECPADAIKPDTDIGDAKWLALNAEMSAVWPNLTKSRTHAPDATEFDGRADKYSTHFSAVPGNGD
jgi:ferredoxin